MTQFTSDNAKAMQAKSVESRNHRKALQKELLKDGDKVLKELLNHDIDMSGLTIDSSVLADVYKDVLLAQLKHKHNVELTVLKSGLIEIDSEVQIESSSNAQLVEPMNLFDAINKGMVVMSDDDLQRLKLWTQ
ncbi:hypothetical protein A134_11135 [Vibrio crassostreae 9CS106]|nr:hypothetical protein A134_11135 [Vibrio crassostreae 9CS106]